ncbi:MAG: DUF72 domain-containing protein [Nitrospira sp.]|nr:DUF72 domain-containing protein [Nitrospira sp.]
MLKYRIGCSGFLYELWKGPFYPEDLPHKKWLTFYMQQFKSVELNVTFYRLLKKEAFERWYKETPPDFTFCVKGSRFITHVKKLKDVELPVATFFNTTAPLMEKLDVVLWQLPPNLKLNLKNLEDFVEILKPYPVRHVFEFRHKSWLVKKVYNLLESANMGVCMSDWPDFIDDLPTTSDFVYIRRHGEDGGYATNYTTDQIKKDAQRIKEYLKEGKDVYFYFNNDAFGYAPKNAEELMNAMDNIISKTLRDKLENTPEITAKRKKSSKKKAVLLETMKSKGSLTKKANESSDKTSKKKPAAVKATALPTKAAPKKPAAKKTAAKKKS